MKYYIGTSIKNLRRISQFFILYIYIITRRIRELNVCHYFLTSIILRKDVDKKKDFFIYRLQL